MNWEVGAPPLKAYFAFLVPFAQASSLAFNSTFEPVFAGFGVGFGAGVGVGAVGASVAQTGTSAAKAMGTPAKKMSLTLTNPEVPSGATKKGILNETGYANIVLMSIIVIIIVAIICVFIFL